MFSYKFLIIFRSSKILKTNKKGYKQKTRLSWTKDPLFKDWIILKEICNQPGQYQVNCRYCHCSVYSKASALKAHAKTKKHIESTLPFSKGRQKTIEFKKEKTANSVKVAEARTALYIAQHSSILPVDHLNSLFKSNFSDSCTAMDTKIHRTKATAIINNVWRSHMISSLRADIGDGKYSLIIDESQDITVIKYLGN